MSVCSSNGSGTKSGHVTDPGISKFRKNYVCTLNENDVNIPFPIDDDESLPHLIPRVSGVSVDDYLALKSAILSIETAIAGQDGAELRELVSQLATTTTPFTSISSVLSHFNTDYFVPISGNSDNAMTGSLKLGSTNKIEWGDNCETYTVFMGRDSRLSVNNPAVSDLVLPFPSDAIGTAPVLPLAIVGHDASPQTEGTHHRRVRIFDDLDVVEDIRAGRDVIGVTGRFSSLKISGADISDAYVAKAGDMMSGDLEMVAGSSFVVRDVNGGISLVSDSSGSPIFHIGDYVEDWNISTRNGILYVYGSSSSDINTIVRNAGGGSANLAIGGKLKGYDPNGDSFTNSFIDMSMNGDITIGSIASTHAFYGETASSKHYILSPSMAGKHFNGVQGLIDHFDNVNAHHEEIHSLGSHVVYRKDTDQYNSIILPSPLKDHKSFGEMLEDLINGGNADAYHTHGGQAVHWGALSFSDYNSITITEYLENNFCRKPCAGGSGGTYWGSLYESSTTNLTIEEYVVGTTGNEKGEIATDINGYGYMPYWGDLKQTAGGPTIIEWLNTHGSGGGEVYWSGLARTSQDNTTIAEYIADHGGSMSATNIGNGEYNPYATTENNTLKFNSLAIGAGLSLNDNTISLSGIASGVNVNNLGGGVEIYSGATGSLTDSLNFRTVKAATDSEITVSVDSSGALEIGTTSAGLAVPKGRVFIHSGTAIYSSISSLVSRLLYNSDGRRMTPDIVMKAMGIPRSYRPSDFKWDISGGIGLIVPYNTSASIRLFEGRPYNDGTVNYPSFKVKLRLDTDTPGTAGMIQISWIITATKI